jgi:SM-20-related protein
MSEPALAATRDALADLLAGTGYGVVPGFLEPGQVRALVEEMSRRDAGGEFRPAAVGAGDGRAVRPAIRGDRIGWLTMAAGDAERQLLARFEALRVALNRDLMLGLADLECHYAIYESGARYARHLDRSPKGAERVVSVVLYLNEDWVPGDGGELLIATPEGDLRVEPRAGTLVAFLSQRFEHEVLPALRTRRSLTGWFRLRPVIGAAL